MMFEDGVKTKNKTTYGYQQRRERREERRGERRVDRCALRYLASTSPKPPNKTAGWLCMNGFDSRVIKDVCFCGSMVETKPRQ
jgi:hypothetical protein